MKRLAAIVVLTLLTAGGILAASASNTGKDEATEKKIIHVIPKESLEFDEHWTTFHLKSLDAESTPDKSIYLSAIQLIQLERTQGDATKAVSYLEALAKRATSQPLKNAINRLLVDLALERRDFKEAERLLKKIVDESMIQM